MLLTAQSLAMAPHRERKAALNQLKNRLGARARKYPFDMVPGGTLSRLLYCMEQYPRSFSGFLGCYSGCLDTLGESWGATRTGDGP